MIDDPFTVSDLMARMEKALPIPARLTADVWMVVQKQHKGTPIPLSCRVIQLHYMHDVGGISCHVAFEPDTGTLTIVSLTQLRFDARLPLARAIAAYQKQRVKRIRRQGPECLSGNAAFVAGAGGCRS